MKSAVAVSIGACMRGNLGFTLLRERGRKCWREGLEANRKRGLPANNNLFGADSHSDFESASNCYLPAFSLHSP